MFLLVKTEINRVVMLLTSFYRRHIAMIAQFVAALTFRISDRVQSSQEQYQNVWYHHTLHKFDPEQYIVAQVIHLRSYLQYFRMLRLYWIE